MSYGHVIYFSKASLGALIKTLTTIFALLVLLLIALTLYFYAEERLPSGALVFMLTVAIVIAVMPYLYSPRAYVLTHEGLVIKRILNSIFIPYSEIAYVSLVDFNEVFSAVDIEVWGSNGYYGIFGHFKMLKLGYANLYVTRIGKCILIEKLNGEKYVISPENPEAFFRVFKSYIELRGKYYLRKRR